jgi:hypothetical protein
MLLGLRRVSLKFGTGLLGNPLVAFRRAVVTMRASLTGITITFFSTRGLWTCRGLALSRCCSLPVVVAVGTLVTRPAVVVALVV